MTDEPEFKWPGDALRHLEAEVRKSEPDWSFEGTGCSECGKGRCLLMDDGRGNMLCADCIDRKAGRPQN